MIKVCSVVGDNECRTGNLPVNWPKLLVNFQNGFTKKMVGIPLCVCVRNVILHHFRHKEDNIF